MPTPEAARLTIGIDASRAATEQPTGTERYSLRIIEALLDAGKEHRFRLYLKQQEPLDVPMRAATRQRLMPFPRLWTHARLSAELLAHPTDALFVPAHVVPLVHPRATVVTIHDLGYRYEPDAHTDVSRSYLELSTRWSVHAAARVIAVSGATRDDLVRHYQVPQEKIDVVPHGVDAHFRPAGSAEIASVRQRLDLPARFILAVGTLQPRKNPVRLVQAFDRLADADGDLSLVLVGKRGWLTEGIDDAVEESRHRSRIVVTGHVADDDLPAVYSAAAVFAFPSLYEGFGLPAIEAMACGVPVVVSDRGALPELAGEATIIIDPLDIASIARGIESALDPAARERRVAAGLRQAATYRWDLSGEQTLESIERAWRECNW